MSPDMVRHALESGDAADMQLRLSNLACQIGSAHEGFKSKLDALEQRYGVRGLGALAPSELIQTIDKLLARRSELGPFLALRAKRRSIAEAGLGEALNRLEDSGIGADGLVAAVDALFTVHRAKAARRSPPLLDVTGITLDANRRTFAERDLQKTGKRPPFQIRSATGQHRRDGGVSGGGKGRGQGL